MKGFIKAYKNISAVSASLVSFGMKIALSVLVTGIFAYKYNELFIGGYRNSLFAVQIIQTAWSLFVLFILGGILIDCFEKSR